MCSFHLVSFFLVAVAVVACHRNSDVPFSHPLFSLNGVSPALLSLCSAPCHIPSPRILERANCPCPHVSPFHRSASAARRIISYRLWCTRSHLVCLLHTHPRFVQCTSCPPPLIVLSYVDKIITRIRGTLSNYAICMELPFVSA
jgi:hypothetical protein